jgi:integrase
VVHLRWEQVAFKSASLHIRRAKNGTPATHPLSGREMRELRRHQRESPSSPFVFVSERGAQLSAPGFSRMVERAVAVADLGIKSHAHMLRHACGYKLANDGHDTWAIQAYLGHRNIQNTTRYGPRAAAVGARHWLRHRYCARLCHARHNRFRGPVRLRSYRNPSSAMRSNRDKSSLARVCWSRSRTPCRSSPFVSSN